MNPCPHCGATDKGIFRSVQASGACKDWFWDDGTTEIDSDPLYFIRSGKLRCGNCFKIRRDVAVDDMRIVEVK